MHRRALVERHQPARLPRVQVPHQAPRLHAPKRHRRSDDLFFSNFQHIILAFAHARGHAIDCDNYITSLMSLTLKRPIEANYDASYLYIFAKLFDFLVNLLLTIVILP